LSGIESSGNGCTGKGAPALQLGNGYRSEIQQFESALKAVGGETRVAGSNDIFPLIHRFVPGMYCREIFMPAGSVLTTMIHRFEHFAFILTGKARVVSEDRGDEIIEAPAVLVTKAGTKRVLHILGDMRWATVHLTEGNGTAATKTDEDLAEIESTVVARTFEEYEQTRLEYKEATL
jgi:hypothetical protein